ncbi:MAG: Imm31 family immunity protein [Pseudomonadota bacterium]
MPKRKPSPLFDFYEIAQIVSNHEEHAEIDRRYGVIGGMSYSSEFGWSYGVSVFSDPACTNWIDGWVIEEQHLVKTGRTTSEAEFMSGYSIRVTQDGQISGQ